MTEASGGKTSSNDNYCAWLNDCSKCPLGGRNAICLGNDKRVDNLFDTIQTVEKWAKEHPFVTNANKFEDTWGHKPVRTDDSWFCPSIFKDVECNSSIDCDKCTSEFWNSEYKEPKKEGDA